MVSVARRQGKHSSNSIPASTALSVVAGSGSSRADASLTSVSGPPTEGADPTKWVLPDGWDVYAWDVTWDYPGLSRVCRLNVRLVHRPTMKSCELDLEPAPFDIGWLRAFLRVVEDSPPAVEYATLRPRW